MKKKQKKDPIQHEKDYIEFLQKQLAWMQKQQDGTISEEEIGKVRLKLSKARLILRILEK